MKSFILVTLLCIIAATQVKAAQVEIEPVYGFERSWQPQPEPARYKTEIFTGIKASYGWEHFAFELELNQGSTSYSVNQSDVKTSTQNYLFGIRLVPFAAEYYNINFRAGMRARKMTRETTLNGKTETHSDGMQLDPYGGTGISVNVGGIFSLNASATLIYNRNNEPAEQYDTRYTFGAAIKFGSHNM